MSEFDILPIIFRLARLRDGKDTLTWDEYSRYLKVIRVMGDLFTFIDTIDVDGILMHIDCILLRDVGEYKAGSRFDYVGNDGIQFMFYITEKSVDPVMVKKIFE